MRYVNSQQRWERAVALVMRVRELAEELERLPKAPIAAFLNREMRRQYRRFAARLRAGKVEPRYKNLFTAEQLADICEAACDRDERLEKIVKELRDLADELRDLLAENEAELNQQTMAELLPIKEAARWLGPGSETEQRFREIQQIRRQGQRRRNHPQKPGKPDLIPLPGTDYELHLRHWLSAAETLPDGAPDGEAVVYFPEGSSEDRIVLRIGISDSSWVGSFQRGSTDYTTVQLMPDNRHLLVVAAGAGYIVESPRPGATSSRSSPTSSLCSSSITPTRRSKHSALRGGYGAPARSRTAGSVGLPSPREC